MTNEDLPIAWLRDKAKSLFAAEPSLYRGLDVDDLVNQAIVFMLDDGVDRYNAIRRASLTITHNGLVGKSNRPVKRPDIRGDRPNVAHAGDEDFADHQEPEDFAICEDLLDQLGPESRMIIDKLQAGYSVAEIAYDLDCSRQWANELVVRARQDVQRIRGGDCG